MRWLAIVPRMELKSTLTSYTFKTIAFLSTSFFFGMFVAGCVTGKKNNVTAPTQTDRILQAYPEIQSGRVLILADFEDEKQMELFQLEGATDSALVRDLKKGKPETGTAALAVTYTSPSESLLMTSPRGGEAFLKRDWRPYDLLMISVHSPVAGLGLEIKIVGGVSGHAVEAVTQMTLDAGWNQLRFDLAEVGGQVPLDDIQEIRLAPAEPPGAPVTFYYDDFLLAGNRRDLLGDSANTLGGLYVQNAGRHWNIGAGGRFEISFRNGQIVRWFNLAADPYRLENLVRGTSLGPLPVVFGEGKSLKPAMGFDHAIRARQRILEMNEVRVVAEVVWENQSGSQGTKPSGAASWLYTVYPTGQVFVSVTLPEDPPDSSAITMAVNLAASPAAPIIQVGRLDESAAKDTAFAVARFAESDSALLFIPYPDKNPAQIKEVVDATTRTASLLWSRGPNTSASDRWRGQLFLTPSSTLDEFQAAARALDYIQPGSVRTEIGQPMRQALLRGDGFDPGTGCFHVTTDGNRARLVIEGKKRAVFSPTFQVEGGGKEEAWVYVNSLLHKPVVRGPQGDVLFQIPGCIAKQIVVEPLFRKPP